MDSLVIVLIVFAIMLLLFVTIGKINNDTDWGNPLLNILDGWLRFYCKKYHRLGDFQISLPTDRKIILVSNHISAIDPLLIISATNRPVRFMIAKEEYERPILRWIFKGAGCIPVDRRGRVDSAFRATLRAIEAGELVAIFPQGGIHSRSDPKQRIKSGVIKISELSGSAILPVRIAGVVSPGTMLKSAIERNYIRLDIEKIIEPQQVLSENFRTQLSQWLIGGQQKLTL